MSPEEAALIAARKSEFESFYTELMPCLVEFVGNLGITPPHAVLTHAEQCLPHVDHSLQKMPIENQAERVALLARIGYFVGEYFVQKFGGSWFVNEILGSRYFGRYVVGRFSKLKNYATMIDPFEMAEAYVDDPLPRNLGALISEVELELDRS